jgi:hypothetical protein
VDYAFLATITIADYLTYYKNANLLIPENQLVAVSEKIAHFAQKTKELLAIFFT